MPISERLVGVGFTIAGLGKAADSRFAEAEALRERGYALGSIYLFGYCVEITLGLATFRNRGLAADTPFSDEDRKRAMKEGREQGIMRPKEGAGDPHPLIGWARLLIDTHDKHAASPYEPGFAQQIVNYASIVYNEWRPILRYHAIEVDPSELTRVREAALWFRQHEREL